MILPLLVVLVFAMFATAPLSAQSEGVVLEELLFEEAPFQECHASTLVAVDADADVEGATLLAAWFAGTREGHRDVGIWISRRRAAGWSAPLEVATGAQPDGSRHPSWNPVLFRPSSGAVQLFYKVGPNPRSWWGMVITSADGGHTWSESQRLPEGILGPIKNKPLELDGGVLLAGSSTEHDGWRVHFELFDQERRTWKRIGPVAPGASPPGPFGAIQPTLLRYTNGGSPNGRLQALCRSQQGRIVETWSHDGGESWTELAATVLPNPNAGIDAVTLRDGRQLLVYNHQVRDHGRWEGSRSRLNVALSSDGAEWSTAVELENQPGEYSYPAVIQGPDGLVHVTYTWRRERIKHVVLDPVYLVTRPMPGGVWPSGDER